MKLKLLTLQLSLAYDRYTPCQLKCLSRWILSYAKEMGAPGEQIDSSTVAAHIGLVIRSRPPDRKLGGARTTMDATYKVLDSFTKCSTIRIFCQTTWHDIKRPTHTSLPHSQTPAQFTVWKSDKKLAPFPGSPLEPGNEAAGQQSGNGTT